MVIGMLGYKRSRVTQLGHAPPRYFVSANSDVSWGMHIDPNEPAAVNVLASELVEGLTSVFGHEMQRSADAAKWSLAALLTMNGGAVLAILSSQARFSNPVGPATVFTVGMFFTILSAAAVRIEIRRDANRAALVIRQANRVTQNRLGAPKTVKDLTNLWQNKRSDKLTKWLAFLAEACSAALFLVGALWSIQTIDPVKIAHDRQCEALQSDMLSARPRRSDSKDLFVALGCRPQGSGNVFAKPQTSALPHRDKT